MRLTYKKRLSLGWGEAASKFETASQEDRLDKAASQLEAAWWDKAASQDEDALQGEPICRIRLLCKMRLSNKIVFPKRCSIREYNWTGCFFHRDSFKVCADWGTTMIQIVRIRNPMALFPCLEQYCVTIRLSYPKPFDFCFSDCWLVSTTLETLKLDSLLRIIIKQALAELGQAQVKLN